MKEENPRDTPEESRTDENPPSGSKSTNNTVKDRKCDYCHQSFTSSSLGRHLDQFIYKKKPDGIHDVEAIRRVRSSITRRQARTTTGKRDGSPDGSQKRGQSESYGAGDSSSSKARDPPVRMMFNTPTWHATGVINDIPNPSRTLDAPRIPPSQPRAGSGSWQLPDYASRGATANNPDTMKALELALREVLDNIKAARYAKDCSLHFPALDCSQSSLLVRVSGLEHLRSTLKSNNRPFRRSVSSFSLLPRVCSRLIHLPPRLLSRFKLPV